MDAAFSGCEQKSHGPKIAMGVDVFMNEPRYLVVALTYKGQKVEVVARPLHMLQRIDPVNCEAVQRTPVYLNYFDEPESNLRRRGGRQLSSPANRVQISYPGKVLNTRARKMLSHILQLLFPKPLVQEMLRGFRRGSDTYVLSLGDMNETIECLRQWHRAKKLLYSVYPEASGLEITQHISERHDEDRKHLENLLKRSEVVFKSHSPCGPTAVVFLFEA